MYLDAGHIGEVKAQHKVLKAGRRHETKVKDHVSKHFYQVSPHSDCLQAEQIMKYDQIILFTTQSFFKRGSGSWTADNLSVIKRVLTLQVGF